MADRDMYNVYTFDELVNMLKIFDSVINENSQSINLKYIPLEVLQCYII